MREKDVKLPPEQEAIRATCFHPSGRFVAFPIEDVETSVPARFAKMVAQYPNNRAIVTDSESLTYAELNERADCLAHTLVDRFGPGPQTIGLLFESKLAMIIALLGTLKAGKIWIVLDPGFPRQRSCAIIADVRAHCLLVEQKTNLLGREIADGYCEILDLAMADRGFVGRDSEFLLSPDSIAGISYTSGSTGKPKGVIWTHRNMLHQVMLFTNEFHHCERDRFSYLSHGTHVMHPFYALLIGAAVLPFDARSHGRTALITWLEQANVTVCAMSTPLFRLLENSTRRRPFPHLRLLRLSSEAAYRSDFDLYHRLFPEHCLLANSIGPSESFLLTTYLMDHSSVFDASEIPIGYPVQSKEILILDEAGEEVGPNQVGEVVVGSAYLSPGYWNLPELTAAKFETPDGDTAVRWYRSGDLALRRPDGCLIHKGRKDFRVKIRGYSVETAEIEKVLRGHAAVQDCIVVDQKRKAGGTELIAYYTSSVQLAPNTSELRRFLIRALPTYMVPARFVQLDAIPITPNGKIDRRALPDPGAHRPELSVPYVAPESDWERSVSRIFAECTGIGQVGIHDNFFELGGDSLALARVESRLSETFRRQFLMQELFDSPSVAGIVKLLNSPPQRVATDSKSFLAPVSNDTQLPLSFSQERLWFLDQLEPASCTYNLVSAYRLRGDLNCPALEQSVNEIIRRHEVLRTVFKAEEGSPVQIVLPSLAIKIPLVDFGGDSPDEQWMQARRLFTEEAQRPFDLEVGPLLRFTLLRLGADDHILLRAAHHIVSDAWSGGIFFFELAEIYQAALIGQASPLADLPIQYANYAKWQRDWLAGDRFKSQLSYWKKRLENIEPLNLPTDHRRAASGPRRGGRRRYALSQRLASQLKSFSRDHGATLFMTLIAAFQTLLHRYCNQTDIAIGSPVAGRNHKEFEKLIGFFLNMLVLRLDLSGNPTFVEVLRRAREMCLGALSHQELPFEKLVAEMQPDRSLAQNPLFQVTFAFQNAPRVPPQLAGITVDELEVESGIGRFDLHLFMEEIDGQLQGYCDYDKGLFDAGTIERMLGHFENLLEAIADNPHRRIADLPLLSESERAQLLVDWNSTKREYPGEKCLHELFEEQVKSTPDAVAVVYDDQALTYAQLNGRANQLAHYLKKKGVGPEVLVGISVERSLEMVVGLLGIVKAGGAYLPLAPSYPQERLAFMMEDAGVSVLVARQGVGQNLSRHDARLVELDGDWSEIAKESEENPEKQVDGRNLVYVIYTSGSTGTPRGVMITHQAACNHMLWMQAEIPLESSDCVLQKTALSFDASVWEVFAPLLAGAKLAVALPQAHRDPRLLLDQAMRHKVTVLQVVPSQLKAMLAEESFGNCTSLKRVFCGGEVLTAELAADFLARTDAQLYNLYGPTEATIDATCGACSRTMTSTRSVPIGKPIANTQVYLLDPQLQPVPVGVSGEIHIGGAGLARGYLNRPELTAEKFIPNPFSAEPDYRLYKTGDLGRYLADGNIEFLGRVDQQIKLRGYRIELGEIESVLGQHPSVKEVAVLVREDSRGDMHIVAYCVAREGRAFNVDDAKRFLKAKLPAYMLPEAWVTLPSLPRLSNGKLDRVSLPAPAAIETERLASTIACTPLEKLLAQVWAELLPHAEFGITDNFFELGGHSLLATRVVARVSKTLGTEIPLRFLFEAPTIRELAQRITVQQQRRSPKEMYVTDAQLPEPPPGGEGSILI